MFQEARITLSLVGFSLVVFSANVDAQATAARSDKPTQTLVKVVRIAPGSLKGRILRKGTRSPVSGQQIALRAGKKTLARVTTPAGGVFRLPPLSAGRYVLQIAQGLELDLVVARSATLTDLDIVIPESALTVNVNKAGTKGTVVIDKASAKKSGKQGEIPVPDEHPTPSFQEQVPNYQVPTAPGAGVGASIATSAALPTWAIVAAGVTAVAVPVAVIAANNNDNDPPPASPSSSHGRR